MSLHFILFKGCVNRDRATDFRSSLSCLFEIMANEFDQYREALLVETTTVWPEEYDSLDLATRQNIEGQLHAEPEAAAELTHPPSAYRF